MARGPVDQLLGYYISALPRLAIGNYTEFRSAAFVPGYGWTMSNAMPVSDIWG
ncbi:hypothetical protein [Herbiconiux sp. A18JL235]|uniref:Uncharacterized protein n=1 Tax=Herbiconiux sp. A18JL235 TaxID=3152363 RepID=A0AB39BLH9_9MICO